LETVRLGDLQNRGKIIMPYEVRRENMNKEDLEPWKDGKADLSKIPSAHDFSPGNIFSCFRSKLETVKTVSGGV